MSPLLRGVLAVLAGSAVAIVIVSLSDVLVGMAYPLPAGTDIRDAESMGAAVAAMPATQLALLVVGWALAAGIGAFVAARMAPGRGRNTGLIVTALLLAATIANLAALPHPAWMWPAALLLIPTFGWFGARAGSSIPSPDTPTESRGT